MRPRPRVDQMAFATGAKVREVRDTSPNCVDPAAKRIRNVIGDGPVESRTFDFQGKWQNMTKHLWNL